MENKETSPKGNWWSERPGSVPGINSEHPGRWADLCGDLHSRGRMPTGQTGPMTGKMGHVHGKDGAHSKGCPAKILYVYHSFRNHYIFNSKTIKSCNCNCRKLLRMPGENYFL